MPATADSRVLEGYRPPFDATAVRKVMELGGIVVGKTNLDEFGIGSSTEGSAFQVTANPWDESRVPGGSSGGSAAAVSARQCVVSLGSDTCGSVRQPVVIGCFGTSVAFAGTLLHAISGHDTFDATSSKRETYPLEGLVLYFFLFAYKSGRSHGIINHSAVRTWTKAYKVLTTQEWVEIQPFRGSVMCSIEASSVRTTYIYVEMNN